jgi:hypothetical protein
MLLIPAFFQAVPTLFNKIWSVIKKNLLFVLMAALSVMLLLLFRGWGARPDGMLKINWMGSPAADGILIDTPSGNRVLINGGESENALLVFLDQKISTFDRKLDAIVVTGESSSQGGLIDLLPLFRPDNIYVFQPDSSPTLAGIEMKDGTSLGLDRDLVLKRRGGNIVILYRQFSLLLAYSGMVDCDASQVVYLSEPDLDTGFCHPQIWITSSGVDPTAITLEGKDWLQIKTDGSNLWMEAR